jgi:dipeptidyl aminopeptidase/acylaminoacyl peptidase
LDRITAPISIHHSDTDATVPLAWSEDLCGRLQALNHPVECFTYHAIPHTFNGPGDTLLIERVIEFFKKS